MENEDDTEQIIPLDEADVEMLKAYGRGPYAEKIARLENDIEVHKQRVNKLLGVVESDTGVLPASHWDLPADKQMMAEESALLIAVCTSIIENVGSKRTGDDDEEEDGPAGDPLKKSRNDASSSTTKNLMYQAKLANNVGKYCVGLGEKVAPTDIERGMRVGLDRTRFAIQIPLPSKIDAAVSLMQVDEKPDTTYCDIGGCDDTIKRLREVVELPLLHPERFIRLGIDPPKGALLYGPPGTGKTLTARAVANATNACFIRVIGSELTRKYVGEGARMVRELFKVARTKLACIVFFDEIDAIGTSRGDSTGGEHGDNEVQRTMLQISAELDGFDPRGNIKVLMATNRPDILDPALVRPGRIDRKVEFTLPDLAGRIQILKIHCKKMSVDKNLRYDLIARLCPNTTGAELRSVCTEAGMFCLRARRKSVSEKDFLLSVEKVIKGYKKYSSTPKYMVYN